jgi:L-amino acid N-acyltransferase YncA
VKVRAATLEDAAAITAIYNPYIQQTVITFEEELITAADMQQRMSEYISKGLPWLVVEDAGQILGYAYAGPWHKRSAYRFSVESSVYLKMELGGQGYGTALYTALLDLLRAAGIRSVIGGIALPNEASVRLHERFGFQKAAHYSRVGYKFGQWLDVGYWQLQLE